MKTPPFTSLAPKIIFALLAACVASVGLHAQLLAIGLPGQRALGQRTFEAGAGIVDAKVPGIERNGQVFSIGINLPVSAHVDLGFSYGRGGIKIGAGKLEDYLISTSAVLHSGGAGARPFLGASLGYERTKITLGSFKEDEDGGIWALSTGIQIPVGGLTLTPAITYADATNGERASVLHWGVHANYWFNAKLGGFADVTFSDFRDDGDEAWTYRLGIRLKF